MKKKVAELQNKSPQSCNVAWEIRKIPQSQKKNEEKSCKIAVEISTKLQNRMKDQVKTSKSNEK